MAQITLGNFFTSGGKTVSGGTGGSGIDTQSLVKALTDAKAIPATEKQDKIKINDAKTAALVQFQTLLNTFKDASSVLRNPPGVGNAADNAFKYTTTTITSNTSVAGSDYVSVSSSPGAALQSYTIDHITSLAAATKQASGDINIATAQSAAVSDTPAAGQFKTGTFTLRGKSLTFNAGESLNSVAAKFNSVSADTGISASVIKVETGKYQLSFSATQTGEDNAFDLADKSAVDDEATLYDPDGVFTQITIAPKQDAANAEFKFNDVLIERQSNSISDLVDGATFTLKQTTVSAPTTEITVAVEPDKTIIKSNIIAFLNAYNDLKIFAAKQSELKSDGTYKDTAALHDNATFRNAMSSISSQLSSVVAGLGSSGATLSDLGITFTDQAATEETPLVRNIFTINDAKLASALADDPEGVRKIFEFDLVSDNTALRVFSRTNALGTNNFTLTVNPFATQKTQTLTVADADTAIVATSPAAGQFKAGIITINGENITLADGDSLNDIIAKFTAAQADTGVAAALTQVDTGQYSITFTSTVTGSGKNFDLKSIGVDPANVFGNVSITATGSYKATYDNGSGPVTIDVDATAVKNAGTDVIGSYSIKGKAGTVLEGLVLIYAATTSSLSSIAITQGIADKTYNVTSPVLAKETGSIAIDLTALKDSDARLNNEITKINEQVETYRQQLLEKFARMEQAISSVNTLLASLQANDDARNNSN